MTSTPNGSAADQELIDVLAALFPAEDDARLTVRKAGYPENEIPSFTTPLVFWSAVVSGSVSGKIRDAEELVNAAKARFPYSRRLTAYQHRRNEDGRPAATKISMARFLSGTTKTIGRESHLHELDMAWDVVDAKVNVVVIKAWAGAGKTSLVVEWLNRMRDRRWHGASAVFAWTFYGSKDVESYDAISAALFMQSALQFFGDAKTANDDATPQEKGERLADLVAASQSLLVLDGLDPLQHPPGPGVEEGTLADPGIAALLHALANHNGGLCVITTREDIPSLAAFGSAVRRVDLEPLSDEDADALMRHLLEDPAESAASVKSTPEQRRALQTEVRGHALTISLVVRYIRRVSKDFSSWHEVGLQQAGDERTSRVMEVYERWLSQGSTGGSGRATAGQRQLALLGLLGLFDRPAEPPCIRALCEDGGVSGLTEPLERLDRTQWREVVSQLEGLGLVSRMKFERKRIRGYDNLDEDTGEARGEPVSKHIPPWDKLSETLHAHPLVRDYFGRRLRQRDEAAWRMGHGRLFDHLCKSVPAWPEGLDALQPLYQAVKHGCRAGRMKEAWHVYRKRIRRDGKKHGVFYSTMILGAVDAELGTLACFFHSLWDELAPEAEEQMEAHSRASLLNEVAYNLQTRGRLDEAANNFRRARDLTRTLGTKEGWEWCAACAGNLARLHLIQGDVDMALQSARESVELADQSSDDFQRITKRMRLANMLHQAGRFDEAVGRSREVDIMLANAKEVPTESIGAPWRFLLWEISLFEAERYAWRATMQRVSLPAGGPAVEPIPENRIKQLCDTCEEVHEEARALSAEAGERKKIMSMALLELAMSRALLYRSLLASPRDDGTSFEEMVQARRLIDTAIVALENDVTFVPGALLTRAWILARLSNQNAAEADLVKAQSIAERCGMLIFSAEAHLTRARLFADQIALTTARERLAALGYNGYRRDDPMLKDAVAAVAAIKAAPSG